MGSASSYPAWWTQRADASSMRRNLAGATSMCATLSRYLGHEFSPTETRRRLQESGITILDVISRARDGERRAIEAIEETASRLGEGLAIVINTLNPSRIYVGGEITELWDQVEPV